MLNRIKRVLIPIRCIFFFGSLSQKNLWIKRAWPRAILRWLTNREVFSSVHEWVQSAHKNTRVGLWIAYNPRGLPGVSITGPGVDGVLQI
jgi:hypothetical protein